MAPTGQDREMKSDQRQSVYTRVLVCIAAVFAGAVPADAQIVRADRLRERGAVLRRPIAPPVFRGHWSVDLRDCGQPATDDSQLWVTATAFNFYETAGTITRIAIEDASRAVLTVRSKGEGTTFVSKKGLTLSSDREALTVRDQDDTGRTTFHRCAVTDAAATSIPHHTMPRR